MVSFSYTVYQTNNNDIHRLIIFISLVSLNSFSYSNNVLKIVKSFFRDLQTQGRLPLGPFTISPGGGTVPAGGNALISVECMPESDVPRKFEEVS